jgi:hypothetical protein
MELLMKCRDRFFRLLLCIVAFALTAVPSPVAHAFSSTLLAGGALHPGESLVSGNGQYELVYQMDGNLVVYGPTGQPGWWTGTDGTSAGAVTMQSDGNLVITDASGAAIWSSGTGGHNGAFASLRDNGTFAVLTGGGEVLWASTGSCAGGPMVLCGGQSLRPGESIASDGGNFTLVYQLDGNLVLYAGGGAPIWWSGTDGTSPGDATMQSDGNFVIHDAGGTPIWWTGTDGHPGAFFLLQANGHAGVFSDGGELWGTGT